VNEVPNGPLSAIPEKLWRGIVEYIANVLVTVAQA
jgi:hypothetical protein